MIVTTAPRRPTPTPTKEGAAFEGWYTDAALTNVYDFSTPITKDLILYAKWTEITLTSLNELIIEATQLNDNNYEDESYEVMYSKLQAAKVVAASQNPTPTEIYNAYQALIDAINQLIAKPYRATSKLGFDPMPVDGLIYVTTNSSRHSLVSILINISCLSLFFSMIAPMNVLCSVI